MVGEENVDGRQAARAAPGSHTHPPRWRLGLGTGEAGVARYLAAPSQPRCFTVAVLAGLWCGDSGQPLNTGRSPSRARRVLGCPGRQPIGVEVVLALRGGGVLARTRCAMNVRRGLVTQFLRGQEGLVLLHSGTD